MSFMNELFKFDNEQVIYGLTDELKCAYIHEKYEKINKSILIVLNTLYEANSFYQSLSKYNEEVYLFPMDDFLTSEAIAISPELKITRLETIENILNSKKCIVITNLMGYLRYLPSKETYQKSFIELEENSEINVKELINKLDLIGYERQTVVTKTGEMAIRGFIIDIFPINAKNPVRIELFGDEIDSIRYFDIDTQLTIKNINSISITPNSEFIIDKSIDFESTQNVYIEGDNLNVLKILRESYLQKIKMIYIDPPYNTGHDFVYKDRYHEPYKNYLKETGQLDEEGNITTTNREQRTFSYRLAQHDVSSSKIS